MGKEKQTLEKGEQNKDQESKVIEIPNEILNIKKVIGVIYGGSEIIALTQSAVKRHARELNSVNSTSLRPTSTPSVTNCPLLIMTCKGWLVLTTTP